MSKKKKKKGKNTNYSPITPEPNSKEVSQLTRVQHGRPHFIRLKCHRGKQSRALALHTCL